MTVLKTFSQLGAAPRPGAALSDEILSGHMSHVILYGERGCGKTTASFSYGRALLCTSRSSDGSFCGACDACRAFGEDGSGVADFLAWDCGARSRIEDIGDLLEFARISPFEGLCRVIQLEEMHCLSPRAQNALLKPMEVKRPWQLTIIGSTTDINKILPAVRNRSREILVPPFTEAEGVEFIIDECSRRELLFESEALPLLHRLTQGRARDILSQIGRIPSDGELSVELVRSAFNLDSLDAIDAWGRALLDRNLQAQVSAIQSWEEGADVKIERLYEAAVHTFLTQVEGLSAIDPIFTHARSGFGDALAAALRRTALETGLSVTRVGHDFIAKLQPRPVTETGLAMLASELHRMVNGPHERFEANAKSDEIPRRRTRVRLRAPPCQPSGSFASYSKISDIAQASSFLVQHHGRLFDTFIHLSGQVHHGQDWAQLVSEGLRLTRAHIRYRESKAPEFHWITSHHASDTGQASTCIAAFVGRERLTDIRDKLTRTFEKLANRSDIIASVRVDVSAATHVTEALAFHGDCMRRLVSCVDPSLQARSSDGRIVPLFEMLGVRKEDLVPAMDSTGCESWGRSETLGPSAQKKASPKGLDFLCAFRDHAWEWLYCGWELLEHADRTAEITRHASERARIERQFSGAGLLERIRRSQTIELLNDRIPDDPRHRIRRWKGWWAGGCLHKVQTLLKEFITHDAYD